MLLRALEGMPPLLRTEEVARLLGLNPATVLLMARDGRLPARRLPGLRKYQFPTAELVGVLRDADEDGGGPKADGDARAAGDGEPPDRPHPPSEAAAAVEHLEPCDVWGLAPAPRAGEDWPGRCWAHWVGLAREAGLEPVEVPDVAPARGADGHRPVGAVEIDGLAYRLLVGPRRRVHYVDDDGEARWGLADAVWAEPLADDARARPGPTELPVGPT